MKCGNARSDEGPKPLMPHLPFTTIHSANDLPLRVNPRSDEAFLVQSFELAEALIARGANSARIAVDAEKDPTRWAQTPTYHAYARALEPPRPFQLNGSILIVIPTYNERENLTSLIHAIAKYLVADILIVDDNSPDGTGVLADQLVSDLTYVHVLHREHKEGLGPAYLAGFHWALNRGYDLVVEMDCDFSHSPWDLPRLAYASARADLVIGSRYVRGGHIHNWNKLRRYLSRSANRYVQRFLGNSIQDWTGGFRCYRTSLLSKMDFAIINVRGYVFQVMMAYYAKCCGATICEIPIQFVDRTRGTSKLGKETLVEALYWVPKLRFKSFKPVE